MNCGPIYQGIAYQAVAADVIARQISGDRILRSAPAWRSDSNNCIRHSGACAAGTRNLVAVTSGFSGTQLRILVRAKRRALRCAIAHRGMTRIRTVRNTTLARLQFDEEHARGRGVAAPLGKSHHLENAHAAIEPDGQHITGLDGVTGGLLANAIDADMAGFDERSSTGAGLDDPRMPQPFVETLALQMSPLKGLLFEHDRGADTLGGFRKGNPGLTFSDHAPNP